MLSVIGRGVWVIPTLAITFVFVSAGPARGSCAEPISIEQALDQAQTVFVGTVTDLQYGGRLATFEVEDIWKGDLGSSVFVNGGPSLAELNAAAAQGLEVATSVDRSYDVGRRYLVVSHGTDSGALADNSCSMTQPFTADLDRYRPASAHAAVTSPAPAVSPDGLDGWAWIGLAALTLGVVGATTAVLRRLVRNRPSGSATA